MKVIEEWLIPKNLSEVRTFHGQASFYMFVRKFSTLSSPLNKIVKKHVGFKWEEKQEKLLSPLSMN